MFGCHRARWWLQSSPELPYVVMATYSERWLDGESRSYAAPIPSRIESWSFPGHSHAIPPPHAADHGHHSVPVIGFTLFLAKSELIECRLSWVRNTAPNGGP